MYFYIKKTWLAKEKVKIIFIYTELKKRKTFMELMVVSAPCGVVELSSRLCPGEK